ncbi:MAG TPA: CPBP family intramembrane glutamic endopeptidase [Bryobacteraceae bacterium]|nr:CPBP family intramembrane glutamic endopeptidase [Bryobacteraceae bacterium]
MARSAKKRIAVFTAGFLTLLICFMLVAKQFSVTIPARDAMSAALLLAPYWAFGFGFGEWLRNRLKGRLRHALAPLLLMLAYLFSGHARSSGFLGMSAVILAVSILLQSADGREPGWRDWLALALLGVSVDLRFFDRAWPVAGLSGLPKLLFVDIGLYGYLVLRPIGGIGFDLRPRLADAAIGLREFFFFTPAALALGFSLSFLHFHRTPGDPAVFAAGWLFTLFFVALPEELFFRGLLLNLLERRIGAKRALILTSLLFGLAHFNKRAAYFNWRYVILAAVAGVFYGRAWLARRRLVASSITHATVDTVWSIWLR